MIKAQYAPEATSKYLKACLLPCVLLCSIWACTDESTPGSYTPVEPENGSGTTPKTEEETVQTNAAPGEFLVTISYLTHEMARITWGKAVDPDGDVVTYDIYLNETKLDSNVTNTGYQFSGLKELTSYTGKILAKDSQNNIREQAFNFETDHLKFLKFYDFDPAASFASGAPYGMIKTNDSHYVIAGAASDGQGDYFFALKMDYQGNVLWHHTYDYPTATTYEFKVAESKNGILVVGHHHIFELNGDGKVIWHKILESYDNPNIVAELRSVAQDSKGNIYLVGGRGSADPHIHEEAVLTKLDPSGNVLWEKSYLNSIRNFFDDILITPNDELLILGSMETSDKSFQESIINGGEQIDFWVLKATEEGEELWSKTYGDGRYDFPKDIIQLSNGNFAFAGFGWGAYDISKGRIFQIDPDGNEIWNITSDLSRLNSIAETHDNGLIATGRVNPNEELGIFKYDADGNEVWTKTDYEFAAYMYGYAVLAEDDGGYRIAGNYYKIYYYDDEKPHIRVYKTDPEGDHDYNAAINN